MPKATTAKILEINIRLADTHVLSEYIVKYFLFAERLTLSRSDNPQLQPLSL